MITKFHRTDYTKPAPPARGIEYFYAMLVQGGILLRIDGDNLVIDAPLNNVSPVLRAAVEKRKVALVAHLKGLPR